jgi:hypothetical protein
MPLTLEEKVQIIRKLPVLYLEKRAIIAMVLAIKRDHPELPDDKLLEMIFPPYKG